MLGIWVRDNAQGLGTVTFLNSDSRFGALGHGIHDTDTNALMEIRNGRVYETSIRSIQKGIDGNPGGIEGIIVYNRYNVLGKIDKNTDCGIFGTLDRTENLFQDTDPMEIMQTDEIKKGDAKIRCCVEGKVKEYKIRITKIDKHTREENKGLEIEVTDPKLLEITGGIIQGMSGTPIIQNGHFDQQKGNLFEYIEAAKFNADAASKGMSAKAVVTDVYDQGAAADILIKDGGRVQKEVQAKFVMFLRQYFLVRKLRKIYNKTRHNY